MTTDPAAAAAEEIIRKAKLAAYGTADAGNELEGDYGTWDDWRELIEVELRRRSADAPDLADELATALRDLLAAYISAMSSEFDFPNSPWLEREGDKDEDVVAARAVLRRYDDSRRSIDSAKAD